jgi:hypothetical protein
MLKIAHLVHPGDVPPTSDLVAAQPVTFASMVAARDFAIGTVEVELLAVKLNDELPVVPDAFRWLPDLERCVADVADFRQPRKLALVADLLERLYEHTDAEYVIYTNVDIALQPHFYLTVASIIESGVDGFTINRRTISNRHSTPDALPMMYAEVGEPHPGYDCFVCRRDALPGYRMAGICIGSGWIGRALRLNLKIGAERYEDYPDLHATFHIGNERAWWSASAREYWYYNAREYRRALRDLADNAKACAMPEYEEACRLTEDAGQAEYLEKSWARKGLEFHKTQAGSSRVLALRTGGAIGFCRSIRVLQHAFPGISVEGGERGLRTPVAGTARAGAACLRWVTGRYTDLVVVQDEGVPESRMIRCLRRICGPRLHVIEHSD